MTDDIIKRLREATDGMYYAESKAELDGHRSNIIKALGIDHDSAGLTALLDRIDAAERECERMREDAERYRWLRGSAEIPEHSTRWARWEIRRWDGRYWNTIFTKQMDAAIDAARAAERGKK
jgi:hypothetical protein